MHQAKKREAEYARRKKAKAEQKYIEVPIVVDLSYIATHGGTFNFPPGVDMYIKGIFFYLHIDVEESTVPDVLNRSMVSADVSSITEEEQYFPITDGMSYLEVNAKLDRKAMFPIKFAKLPNNNCSLTMTIITRYKI